MSIDNLFLSFAKERSSDKPSNYLLFTICSAFWKSVPKNEIREDGYFLTLQSQSQTQCKVLQSFSCGVWFFFFFFQNCVS